MFYSNWKSIALKDIAEFKNGLNYTSENNGKGIKVINVSDFQDYFTPRYDNLSEINPDNLNIESSLLKEEDIIFVRSNGNKDLVGRSMFVREIEENITFSAFVIRLRFTTKKNINPLFYAYLFKSDLFRKLLSLFGYGTNISNINQEILKKLYVPIPPLNIQNRIVSILSAYDALIENNKKRIRILENMAQEIYKEWFVRMRFPGHKETKFNKGLPIDWKIKLLIDVCQKVTDGTHDSPKSTTEGYYLITGSHIKNGFIDFSKAYLISSEDHYKVQQRSRLDKGDIIFSNIGTLGSCCIIDHDFEFSVKNVAIFKPKEHYFTSFLFCFLTNKATLEQFDLVASGTSQKFLSLNYLRKFKLLVPPMELLIRFDNIVSKIIQERSLLNKSNENLLETRDLLLPRLISGKILVEDINVNAQELMEV